LNEEQFVVETTGETVGEAKWLAVRELEKLQPGLDKNAVRFEVVSEGERGLLGVGFAPARVIASAPAGAVRAAEETEEMSGPAGMVHELLQRITDETGVRCRIDVHEDEDALTAELVGGELGLLIGKHGQTLDAIQYLANAIVYRGEGDRKPIVIDAAGYRERREATLSALAVRSAEEAVRNGEPVELEPMSAIERKLVHVRLQDFPGVETRSEGNEPNRFVVVFPSG
jgi:spoIIIJ-associated protein